VSGLCDTAAALFACLHTCCWTLLVMRTMIGCFCMRPRNVKLQCLRAVRGRLRMQWCTCYLHSTMFSSDCSGDPIIWTPDNTTDGSGNTTDASGPQLAAAASLVALPAVALALL
jgi:hypothetical protein